MKPGVSEPTNEVAKALVTPWAMVSTLTTRLILTDSAGQSPKRASLGRLELVVDGWPHQFLYMGTRDNTICIYPSGFDYFPGKAVAVSEMDYLCAPDAIFCGGFEKGDLSRWTQSP